MSKAEEVLKLFEDDKDAPANAFKHSMQRPVSHMLEDLGNGEYAVATGDKYSVRVKVIGWHIPKTKQ